MDSAPGKIALNCRNLIALVPGIIKAREWYCAVTNGFRATARLVLRSAIRSCPQAPTFNPSFGGAPRCGNRCSLAAASRIWKSSSSPNRCLVEHDGESHEARFKRLRRRNGNSATVHLRWRKPVATFAMVRRAQRNAEFCPALRRSRCARRHMAPLGGLRYSTSPDGACGRRRAEHQTEAGGQRFSERRLWRPVSTSWPWASSLSLPAACPLDGSSSGKGRCVLP